MKLLILTTIIATVASSTHIEGKQWPWQVGKEYVYNIDSYTWTKFEQSDSNGNAFKAQFIIRVLAPGRIVAMFENPLYAQIQGQLSKDALPSELKYQPVNNFEHPIEVFVDGGRILSLAVPTTLPLHYENLLKGVISTLQVDLTSYNHIDSFPNSYDKETFQGLFKKMETDVTGNCVTLYSVSPVAAEWHRELPDFAEDPIEITKSKNYGSCLKTTGYHFGVPEGAVWKGIASDNYEKQFIKHSSESRLLVSKQGTIYKSETLSSVFVNPLIFGKQKAEVYSYVRSYLTSVGPETNREWKKTVEFRKIDSLLFTFNMTTFTRVGENIVRAQKLLQEMTPLLQDPNNFPKSDFLSKFNVLVRLIISMNSEQLTQMTNSVEVAKTSKNMAKNSMWKIYIDAVAQAGTIAAFKQVKAWTLDKKIEAEEAAQLISSMASIFRYPTKKLINEIFDFVMSPEILVQKFLNTTALLAVTKFIRLSGDEFFINNKAIPRLSQELKEAIMKGDGTKAQVYVRVLGNLGNQNILKVFAPYLEGQIEVTKYLRTQMVISLKTVANSGNPFVRAVLFSLLKNTAEPYEVRVAAALNIFLAFPNPEMMQIMAHMTNDDPSTQVRAVLANSISFAAGLKDPRFAPLAKTAKAVLYLVSKENFGYRYSTDSFIDEYTSDDEIAYFREVSFIGSENSILPIYQSGALRFRAIQWTEEDLFTLSVSDMQHLINHITGMFFMTNKVDTDFKFSAKKIAEILNIKQQHQCSLEGSFFLENWNQQMLITFNEEDLNLLLRDYAKKMEQMVSGTELYYTKILSQKQVFVIFPVAIGMPFMFAYSEPTVFIAHSKITAEENDMTVSTKNEIQFTYARNLDGSVGFLDTLGDVYARTGVTNKLQFNIPLKYGMEAKKGETKLKIEFPEQNVNLIHMSVWPHTALQKMDSLLTISEDPSTKFIERPAKVISTDYKLGLLTGSVFEFEGYSYSSDYKNPRSLLNIDLLTNVRNFLYQKDIALTQFNFKYLAKESQNKAVTFNVFYDTLYNQQYSGEMGPASVMSDVTSKARREEILKRVASGIKSAQIQLFDFSTTFDGPNKMEYIFTTALANSVIDNKAQATFFYNGFQQINAVFKITKPKIVPLNFEEALKNELKILYEADFKFGTSENIHFSGFGARSDMYTEMLSNDALAKRCREETSKHNLYQKDCYKMIIKAHAPDYFKGNVTYKDISPVAMSSIYEVYEIFKTIYGWEHKEDVNKRTEENTIEIEAQAVYYDNYINYEFIFKNGVLRVDNVESLPYYPYAMAIYPPLSIWERSRNWYTWLATVSGRNLELEIKPNAVNVKTTIEKVTEGHLTMYYDKSAKMPLLEYYNLAEGVQFFSINNGALRFIYDSQRLVIFTDDHRKTTRGICGQNTSQTGDDYMTPNGLVYLPEYYGASFSLDDEFSDPKTVELKKQAKLKAYQPVTKYTNVFRSDNEWTNAENESIKGLFTELNNLI